MAPPRNHAGQPYSTAQACTLYSRCKYPRRAMIGNGAAKNAVPQHDVRSDRHGEARVALKPGDRLLIICGLAALIAGGAWFFIQHGTGTTEPAEQPLKVVCQSRDGFYRVDELSSDVEYTVTTIDANGEAGQNVVRIADGTVDVISATCSNQICVDHDPIAQAGEEIVCLPHGVVIDVVEDETDAPALIS